MDPRQRPELEENDLLSFLENSKAWWTKHGNKVLIAVLLVLLGLVARQLIQGHLARKHEEKWSRLSLAQNPFEAQQLGDGSSDANYQAQCYLRAGQLAYQAYLGEAEKARSAAATQPAKDPGREHLDLAALMWDKVVALPDAHARWKVNALLSLATVAETRQQIDKARGHLKAAYDLAKDTDSMLAALAAGREKFLVWLDRPLVFDPPATQPADAAAATQSATTPPTQPAATQPAVP